MNRAFFETLDGPGRLELLCRLHAMTVELSERVQQSSANSSRPPSSDGPFKGGPLPGLGGALAGQAASEPTAVPKPRAPTPSAAPRKAGKQPGAKGTRLARQLRQSWRIRSVMAFDEKGHQFVSSQPQVQDWFDLSRTDAFDLHSKQNNSDLRIGSPVRSPTNDDWMIPFTHRLDKPDGSFGGILVATIRVDYFAGFYKSLGKTSGAIISLLSRDGTLLSRYPPTEDMIGRNVANDLWKTDVLTKPEGTLRLTSPVDAVDRVYGFKNTSDYSLVLFVGLSRDAVLAGWLRNALIHLVGAAGLIALFALIGMKLAKNVALRHTSEIALAKLARTDSLTGVMNRRSFDDAFGKAWMQAASSEKPLSLLLLDVDHFKAFNDTYGHPAGDTCLQLVATAMIETVYKPADRVARYGGEEFAVLLPDTGEASAMIFAERIRAAIESLAIPNKGSSVQSTLTVSIGVSTRRPSIDNPDTMADFLSDADRALYKAKFFGRNQVQSTRPSIVKAERRAK